LCTPTHISGNRFLFYLSSYLAIYNNPIAPNPAPTPRSNHQTLSLPADNPLAPPVGAGTARLALVLCPFPPFPIVLDAPLPSLPAEAGADGAPVVTTTVTVCTIVGYSFVQVVDPSLNVEVAIVDTAVVVVYVVLASGPVEALSPPSTFGFGALRLPPCTPPTNNHQHSSNKAYTPQDKRVNSPSGTLLGPCTNFASAAYFAKVLSPSLGALILITMPA
jgi:hypothetical protein